MKNQHPQTATRLHNNNLQSMQNLPQSLFPHCRICLQQDGKLSQLPCACIGQIGLVHEQCFTKWIQTIRNQGQGLRSNRNNLSHVSQKFYQIPCQICRAKIKIQMLEKRSCIGLKDLSKPQIIFSIICIMFNLAVIGVTSYFCISSIVRGPQSGLKIFINIFIMLIMFIVLGWIIKRQIASLIVKNITELKISNVTVQIVNSNNVNNNNDNDQVADFVIIDERQVQQEGNRSNRSNGSNGSNGSNRSNRSNRRRRSQKNRNRNNNQNNTIRQENRQDIIDI